MPLLLLSTGWIIGIFLGSQLSIPIWAIAFSLLPLVLIPFLHHEYKRIILASLVLVLLLSGAVYSYHTLHNIQPDDVSLYNDTDLITVEGIIADEPEDRDRTSTFRLQAERLTTGTEEHQVSGSVLIKTSTYPDYHYGDLIQATGQLKTPAQYEDFDYKAYLAIDDIYSVMIYPEMEIGARDQGSKILSFIYSLRNSFAQSIDRALPEPQSSLAKAIFLGISSGIPQSIRTEFAHTGTNHILAISGLHLTIIIGLILFVGGLVFGRRYNIHIWLAFLIIWLYAVFTGLEPPVVRSAIMGSVFLLAEFLGRQRNALPALTLAAAIMLGIQPELLGDISFQLSYLSMCGLILIYPQFGKLRILIEPEDEVDTIYVKIIRIFLTGLFVIISALIAIAPLIAYYFGVIPVMAIPATIFILPVIPLIIITTALVSITGLGLPFLAMIIGWLDWLFISYFLLVVRIFDSLPLASIQLNVNESWQVWCYYIVLSIIFLISIYWKKFIHVMKSFLSGLSPFINRLQRLSLRLPLQWTLIILSTIVILVWITIFTLPDGKLHVSILNVGQGDAILIQTPSRQNILIDGGPSPQKLKLELGKKLPFWDRKIDMVVITQSQADHITGLIDIIEDYKIDTVVQTSHNDNSNVFTQLSNIIADRQIPVSYVYSGQTIRMGDLEIEILHPPQTAFDCKGDDRDCNCLVMRLVFKDISFLFTADIPEEVEYHLLSSHIELRSTVLKVAHHGSQTSSSMLFLNTVDAETAAISAGEGNPYGHPSPATIANLVQVIDQEMIFLTSQHGTIEYVTDGTSLWVKTES